MSTSRYTPVSWLAQAVSFETISRRGKYCEPLAIRMMRKCNYFRHPRTSLALALSNIWLIKSLTTSVGIFVLVFPRTPLDLHNDDEKQPEPRVMKHHYRPSCKTFAIGYIDIETLLLLATFAHFLPRARPHGAAQSGSGPYFAQHAHGPCCVGSCSLHIRISIFNPFQSWINLHVPLWNIFLRYSIHSDLQGLHAKPIHEKPHGQSSSSTCYLFLVAQRMFSIHSIMTDAL
jgi:hypothetical protein